MGGSYSASGPINAEAGPAPHTNMFSQLRFAESVAARQHLRASTTHVNTAAMSINHGLSVCLSVCPHNVLSRRQIRMTRRCSLYEFPGRPSAAAVCIIAAQHQANASLAPTFQPGRFPRCCCCCYCGCSFCCCCCCINKCDNMSSH